MKKLWFIFMSILMVCSSGYAQNIIEFRLVCSDKSDCIETVYEKGEALYIEQIPVIKSLDIEEAKVFSSELPEEFIKKMQEQGVHVGPTQYGVEIKFTQEGAAKLKQITQENIKRRLAIVLNGNVLTAPIILEPITGGVVQVSGQYTKEQTEEIAAKINQSLTVNK